MRYIAFNKRSIVTARALATYLKEQTGKEWRLIDDKKPRYKISVLLRFGNSYFPSKAEAPSLYTADAIEINSKSAVECASNKHRMILALSSAEGVKIPKLHIDNGSIRIWGENGQKMFVRNATDHIVYRNQFVPGDKYALEEVIKKREFRVHFFGDHITGIYEKVPYVAGDKILKNENSKFVRIDRSRADQMAELKGIRPMVKAGARALGLTFGGADVIIGQDGVKYITEINSAPSLNSQNIVRFSQALLNIIDNGRIS